MSDETPGKSTGETAGDVSSETTSEASPDTTSEAAGARPAGPTTPAATAASRARRIGGRPMPFPHADADPATGKTDATPAAGKTHSKAAGKEDAERAPKRDKAATGVTSTAKEKPKAKPTPADLADLHRRLDRMRWIPAVIAAAAVVAMLMVGVWQAHGLWWGKRLGDTRAEQQQQVLATAKTCAAAVLSYDYRNLDKAQQAAEACITPQFKDQYEATFAVVKQLAPQKKATITFQVANGGIQSVTKDGSQWVVLLYGQSSYADDTTKGNPRLDVSSPIVTLTKVDNRYLVSNLNTS